MPNLATDLARVMGPKVSAGMNGALCAFAMRWELDGDYIRCRKCTSPQLTTYSDRAFLHHPGCKAAGTVETHPWRTYLELLAPLIAAWNTRAASGGDSASREQRARSLLPDGWTHDCQGKQDYDADLLALSCRYYPANYQRNGKAAVSAAVVWGEGDERLFHATLEAETESQVKAMAESWAAEKIVAIRAALANQQGVAAGAYPTGSDREVLQHLMQQFDVETWQCPSCGHAEDTASMDSADYLRKYLAEHPAEQQGVGDG